MSKPELYLIKLFRKALHEPEAVKSVNSASTNEADSEEQSFLAMDYFDALRVKKIPVEENMTMFMDIYTSPDKKLTKYDIAMQSIPVYCSAEDISEYEKSVSVNVKNKETAEHVFPYGNPFDQGKQHPYLSLVQVYIMPEIMARIKPIQEIDDARNNHVRNKVTKYIVNQFYNDIHAIIADYVRDHYQRDQFKCRVYRSMSAGDFTVAISSDRPETAFIIATLLRERGCYYDNNNVNNNRYIFYKTYTLLSCNNQWIHCDQENQMDVKEAINGADAIEDQDKLDGIKHHGRFVLRATFSSKYWGEDATKNINHNYSRLNGRYDFSVELTEKAFRYVSKVLCDYKLGGEESLRWQEPTDEEKKKLEAQLGGEYEKCMDLIRYVSKEHIAYINERYTFECNEMDIFPKDHITHTAIRLSDNTKRRRFISKINDDAIDEVERKMDSAYAKIMSLVTNRRNLLYHMNLLKRMLNLCRSINGLSDTRIYSSILVHQIRVVLDGVEDAYQMLERESNRNIIPIMEHAFSEAVYALNTYAKMIRDNNLQSLQTPNYNLETSVSVEKVLVGYGELLNSLFKWYDGTKVCEEIFGLRQQYIPFMIPGNHDESLNTKVLFKEIKANVSNEKLMVVWSSAFSELTNFGGTVGILFHEVAHNLRYKGRSERNDIITRYCVYLICDQITLSIMNDLELNIPELMESVGLTRLICNSLYKTYFQVVYTERNIQKLVKDYSYAGIIDFIYNEYNKFAEVIKQINEVDKFIRRCISLRPDQRSPEREKALKALKTLRSTLITMQDYSFGLVDYYDYDNPNNKRILVLMEDTINMLEDYIQVHTKADGSYSGDVSAKVIYNMLLANKNHGEEFQRILPWYGLVDRFFKVFAEYLEDSVKELSADLKKSENKRIVDETRKIRRYLARGNRDSYVDSSILSSYVSPHIVRTRIESSDKMEEDTAIYSEVASDLFMYNLVEMTPFGYFNFLSEYAPSDARTAHTYVRRFSIVMYAAFSDPTVKLERAGKKQYWKGFVERLYNDFVLSADKSLDALFETCAEFDDERYIISMENKEGIPRRERLSYWCGYTRAHIISHRNKYFKKSKANIKFFDKKYRKLESGEKKFVGSEQFGMKTNRDLNEKEILYFDYDSTEKEEPTLEHILGKYVKYFEVLCGYVSQIYDSICNSLSKREEEDAERRKLVVLEGLKGEMSRWRFMSSFLHRLCEEIYQEISTIETLDFLADDYREGYHNTRKLQGEFAGDLDKNDVNGCWMWPYFEEVKDLLNHPELRYSDSRRKQTNMMMLEMITELYYRAIRNCVTDMTLEHNNDNREKNESAITD